MGGVAIQVTMLSYNKNHNYVLTHHDGRVNIGSGINVLVYYMNSHNRNAKHVIV
jgi:hypothetical protein